MRIEIAIAALSPATEQRVRIAASLLAAHKVRATVRAWDGTKCAAVVASNDDDYGRRVIGLARDRGTPVLALSARAHLDAVQPPPLPDNSPAPTLAQALLDQLFEFRAPPAMAKGEDSGSTVPALLALCTPALRGQPVVATFDQRCVFVRPQEGRVYGDSLSDLLFTRDNLYRSGWQLRRMEPADQRHRLCDASRSLDSFLLQAAVHGRDHLPPFPPGACRLSDWPDIGSAPELTAALKVARTLLRTTGTAEQLVGNNRAAAAEVNAILWAYRASNLLVDAQQTGPSAIPAAALQPPTGLLRRIASRFGLSFN